MTADTGCRRCVCDFDKLSSDIKLFIAKRSGLPGALSLCQVSKEWYDLTGKSQSFWQSLYPSEVPHRVSQDWRALVMEQRSLANQLVGGANMLDKTASPELRIVAWQLDEKDVRLSTDGILALVDALADAERYSEAVNWLKKLEERDPKAIPDHCNVWRYAERGHTPLLEAALNGGRVDVDARDPLHGSTPLMFAAQEGKVESLRYLISRGADLTAVSSKSCCLGALDFAFERPPVEPALRRRIGADHRWTAG